MNDFPTQPTIPNHESGQPKRLRRIMIGLLVLSIGTTLCGFAAYQSMRWEPSFYANELAVDSNVLANHGQQMEQQVQALHEEVQGRDQWTATFSEEQINGWLAVDLKQNFPRMLPKQIREPRVSLSPGLAQVACQYCSSDLQVILSLDVDVTMSSEPNVVAVRIKRARVGAVPGLLQMAITSITNAATRAKIPLQWTEVDGDKVALVTVPGNVVLNGRRIRVDELRVDDGEIRFGGRSEPLSQPQQIAMR